MKIQIRDFLKSQPNFLIAALVLAYEEDFDPIINALGEQIALQKIREMRTQIQLIKSHGSQSFPISIHRGHILKQPGHVAASIILGLDYFYAQERTIPTQVTIYGNEWLSTLNDSNKGKLLLKNKQILQDPPV